MKKNVLLIVICFVIGLLNAELSSAVEPPKPILPVPSKHQMAWQHKELLMFAHFGVKTYYPDKYGRGSGKEDMQKFNPKKFDAKQWVRAAKAGGFKGIVLTAKHHEGSCNWQTETSDFGVESSPWKNGKGDVIKEVADACHEADMLFGIYMSVWDMNYKVSGPDRITEGQKFKEHIKDYQKFFEKQITELCTKYGVVDEFWFDGCNAKQMGTLDWAAIAAIFQKHQPNMIVFRADPLPNMERSGVRWPRNEAGNAGDPNWSVWPAPDENLKVDENAIWFPAEADAIAQGGWFWNGKPICDLSKLQKIYMTSVGRNGVALINLGPNRDGLIDPASIPRLKEFKEWVDGIYARNIAVGKPISADTVRGNDLQYAPENLLDNNYETYYATDDNVTTARIELNLGELTDINGVIVREYIPLGQRVAEHYIEVWDGSSWKKVFDGTTIGFKRIHWEEKGLKAQKVRLTITRSRACPVISTLSVIRASEDSK
ncbi:alpha-L-fucosidase [Verrucomicrobiota bacterium]